MKIGLSQKVGLIFIVFGIFIFLVAVFFCWRMYLTLSPTEGAGLSMVPVLLVLNAYIVLTFCNLIGVAIIYFSSRKTKIGFSVSKKIIFLCAFIAQMSVFLIPVLFG